MINNFANLESILTKNFNLNSFRKGQKEIISTILSNKDVMGVLPTGGGKSLCYQFIAVYYNKLVVVVSPLIALMKDQVYNLNKIGIPAGCIYYNQPIEEKKEVFAKMAQKGSFVLYLSPERIQKTGFHEWIKNQDVALFAIDEAHCISQWGHDFREEYTSLSVLRSLQPNVPIIALTASATPLVLNDIAKQLQIQNADRKVYGFYRPNLFYQVTECENEDEKIDWIASALNKFTEGRKIIYCGTRKNTEYVCEILKQNFQGVAHYHAGMSTQERTQIQDDYQNGKLNILVATNAFGMGVDQPNVRLVIHYNMPSNIDSLYQEMGRAGRDDKDSTCLLLYSKKDKGLQVYFIESSESNPEIKKLRWKNLNALISYSEGSECRHSEILTYFKDSHRIKRCGHCDVCEPKSERMVQFSKKQKSIFSRILNNSEVESSKKNAGNIKSIKNNSTLDLDVESESRYQKLRVWRKEIAEEKDLPAFVIFHDKTLKEIAAINPQSLDELRKIKGMGDKKIEDYGWDILAELK